ncbi:MAG TPA: hypothetical protein DIW38_09710, partial [Oceanicaulis sp.]|nr:hypothetical protein [Oceanicaulis sp.]
TISTWIISAKRAEATLYSGLDVQYGVQVLSQNFIAVQAFSLGRDLLLGAGPAKASALSTRYEVCFVLDALRSGMDRISSRARMQTL